MKGCQHKTQSGKACKMPPLTGARFCFAHDPARARDRAEARKLGGQNRATPHAGDPATIPQDIRTIDQARTILNYTLAELLAMDNGIPRARALIALFDSHVKAIEIGELEARLSALEATLKAR